METHSQPLSSLLNYNTISRVTHHFFCLYMYVCSTQARSTCYMWPVKISHMLHFQPSGWWMLLHDGAEVNAEVGAHVMIQNVWSESFSSHVIWTMSMGIHGRWSAFVWQQPSNLTLAVSVLWHAELRIYCRSSHLVDLCMLAQQKISQVII